MKNQTFKNFVRSKIFIGAVILLVIIVGGYFIFHKNPVYQFVTVERGSVTETVSLTGNTTPTKSVSLAFGSSGTISRIYSELGKEVKSGQVLAELSMGDLVAGLHQAQANLATQQARLEGLKNGSRPEDIAASQASLDKAKQDLENMYASIIDSSVDGHAKANDAVRVQLGQFFVNGETPNPTLTYATTEFQAQDDAEKQRQLATYALNDWQTEISGAGQSNSALETLLQKGVAHLAVIRNFLSSVAKTLDNPLTLDAVTLATYKTNVSVATNEVNLSAKNLNTISQNISSQKLTVSQLQAQLDLKKAGSLPTDVSAQQAQVDQAQASVDSAYAKIQNAEIVAPIAGTVTLFDAKVGQLASPGTPLVSIMSGEGYEVDAGVSETDIGKVSIGDTVSMTLDAFQNETFTGSVFYIAPAQTNIQGVITYQIKIAFTKPDPRLKSGFTANINIETNKKDGVLVLPQYAILQNDQGTFVETLENGVTKQNKVVLGIQDQKGNVEVLSGVTEGEQVLNIGLKVQ